MTIVKEYFDNVLCMDPARAERDIGFEELCKVVSPIARKRGVDRVYLFGSRARGDNGAESDYDFYIIPGSINSLIGLSGLMRDLEEALGRDVDIISEDPHIKEDLLQEVLRDRKLIYEA